MQKRYFINNQIRYREVRVIDSEGKQIGVLPTEKALQIAREQGLDLVMITDKTAPPVCKIIDFGKFLYQENKRQRQEREHKKVGELKGIRISFNISDHDLETIAKKTQKFLKKGHKVKIEMILRGRQKALRDYAKQKIAKFLEFLENETPFKIERDLKEQGPRLNIIIAKQK